MRWKLLTLAAMLATITALAIVVRVQYVEITRLKQENQSMLAERDAARAQFTHYEQAIALFNQIAGATQDAHQQAVQDFQPRIIQIREAITPERCALKDKINVLEITFRHGRIAGISDRGGSLLPYPISRSGRSLTES
ncbi:hypothetical protein AAH678_16255 [Sodalis endosymbiont of Spalangia cameroni]|uniref:hypothetical protein n=1 Tax=Sodalis praecaptivus TaxID=1239307 RepID=UPI0031F90794